MPPALERFLRKSEDFPSVCGHSTTQGAQPEQGPGNCRMLGNLQLSCVLITMLDPQDKRGYPEVH